MGQNLSTENGGSLVGDGDGSGSPTIAVPVRTTQTDEEWIQDLEQAVDRTVELISGVDEEDEDMKDFAGLVEIPSDHLLSSSQIWSQCSPVQGEHNWLKETSFRPLWRAPPVVDKASSPTGLWQPGYPAMKNSTREPSSPGVSVFMTRVERFEFDIANLQSRNDQLSTALRECEQHRIKVPAWTKGALEALQNTTETLRNLKEILALFLRQLDEPGGHKKLLILLKAQVKAEIERNTSLAERLATVIEARLSQGDGQDIEQSLEADDLRQRVSDLKEELRNKNIELDRYQSLQQIAEPDVAQVHGELSQLGSYNEEATALTKARMKRDDERGLRQLASQQLVTLEKENGQLRHMSARAVSAAVDLRRARINAVRKVDQLLLERDQLKRGQENATKQAESARQELRKVKEQRENSRSHLDRARSARDRNIALLAEYQSSSGAYNESAGVVNDPSRNDDIARLSAELDVARIERDEAIHERDDYLKERAEEIITEHEIESVELRNLRQERDFLATAVLQLEQQLRAAQSLRDVAMQERDECHQDRSNSRAEIHRLDGEIAAAHADLDNALERVSKDRHSKPPLVSNITKIQIAELEDQLRVAENNLLPAKHRIAELAIELEISAEDMDVMKLERDEALRQRNECWARNPISKGYGLPADDESSDEVQVVKPSNGYGIPDDMDEDSLDAMQNPQPPPPARQHPSRKRKHVDFEKPPPDEEKDEDEAEETDGGANDSPDGSEEGHEEGDEKTDTDTDEADKNGEDPSGGEDADEVEKDPEPPIKKRKTRSDKGKTRGGGAGLRKLPSRFTARTSYSSRGTCVGLGQGVLRKPVAPPPTLLQRIGWGRGKSPSTASVSPIKETGRGREKPVVAPASPSQRAGLRSASHVNVASPSTTPTTPRSRPGSEGAKAIATQVNPQPDKPFFTYEGRLESRRQLPIRRAPPASTTPATERRRPGPAWDKAIATPVNPQPAKPFFTYGGRLERGRGRGGQVPTPIASTTPAERGVVSKAAAVSTKTPPFAYVPTRRGRPGMGRGRGGRVAAPTPSNTPVSPGRIRPTVRADRDTTSGRGGVLGKGRARGNVPPPAPALETRPQRNRRPPARLMSQSHTI